MAATETAYTLDNAWEHAHRRLTLIEEIFDEVTTTHLARLGVGPGRRCLELGAGAGSVARWLCDRVGPTGSVTAVDLEPRFLAADPRPNMEVLQRDLVADGVPGEGWDLIHARALLVHLGNREDILRQMVAALRPGGVLLLEEPDLTACAAGDSPTYREVFDRICAAVGKKGSDWRWPGMLPRRLAAAGLLDCAGSSASHQFNGGSPMARFWTLSLEQLTPLLCADGTPEDLLSAFAAELADPDLWFPSFAAVSAWGYRPS